MSKTETEVQKKCQLEASIIGARLWRNNVGVLKNEKGTPIRFGLGNETKEQNQAMKSADLIGIKSVLITEDMVGSTIGQFVARECKKESWKPGEDPKREKAQLNFLEFINSMGGDACFVKEEGSLAGGDLVHEFSPFTKEIHDEAFSMMVNAGLANPGVYGTWRGDKPGLMCVWVNDDTEFEQHYVQLPYLEIDKIVQTVIDTEWRERLKKLTNN